jgi:hypothetical protein
VRGHACALRNIRFSVESMDSNKSATRDDFAIDGQIGFAKICLINSLDYETRRSYDLRLAAISGYGEKLAVIVVVAAFGFMNQCKSVARNA